MRFTTTLAATVCYFFSLGCSRQNVMACDPSNPSSYGCAATSQVTRPPTLQNLPASQPGAPNQPVASNPQPVPTCSITANPTSIAPGGMTTLTIITNGVQAALLNGQTVSFAGSQNVLSEMPIASTDYVLQVSGPGGYGQCDVQVTVTNPAPPPPPLVITLAASPSTVSINAGATQSAPFQITASASQPGGVIASVTSQPAGISCNAAYSCTLPAPGSYSISAQVGLGGQSFAAAPVNVTVLLSAPPTVQIAAYFSNSTQDSVYEWDYVLPGETSPLNSPNSMAGFKLFSEPFIEASGINCNVGIFRVRNGGASLWNDYGAATNYVNMVISNNWGNPQLSGVLGYLCPSPVVPAGQEIHNYQGCYERGGSCQVTWLGLFSIGDIRAQFQGRTTSTTGLSLNFYGAGTSDTALGFSPGN